MVPRSFGTADPETASDDRNVHRNTDSTAARENESRNRKYAIVNDDRKIHSESAVSSSKRSSSNDSPERQFLDGEMTSEDESVGLVMDCAGGTVDDEVGELRTASVEKKIRPHSSLQTSDARSVAERNASASRRERRSCSLDHPKLFKGTR